MLDDGQMAVIDHAGQNDGAVVDTDDLGIPARLSSVMYGRVSFGELCQRLASGEFLIDIAKDACITPPGISGRVRRYPEQHEYYMLARRIGAEMMVERSMGELGDADSLLLISRAREKFRAVAWYAEKTDPERFGRREQVTLTSDLGSALSHIYAQRVQSRQADGRLCDARTGMGDMLNRPALAQPPIDGEAERVSDAGQAHQAGRRSLQAEGDEGAAGSMAGPRQ